MRTNQKEVDTVEVVKFNAFLDIKKSACIYWNTNALLAYNPQLRRAGPIPATFNGVAAPAQVAALIYGGNYVAAAPTLAAGRAVAASTGAYLLTAPEGCATPSP